MSLKPKSINYIDYWKRLSDVALRVLRCEKVSKLQWNSSFSDVYEVCVAKKDGTEVYAELLYNDTFALIKNHIEEIENDLLNAEINEFLPIYVRKWEVFYKGLDFLHTLYSYVNTQHVRNRRPTESDICYSQAVINVSENNMEIKEMGLELWKKTVLQIGDNLKHCLLREIESDRNGERSSYFEHIQEAITSLIIIGTTIISSLSKTYPYENFFENDLLVATERYYEHWAADKSSNLICSNYVIEALELRKSEEQRCRQCYNESWKKISDLFRQIIVANQIAFLNSSVKAIIDKEFEEDLRNLFDLLSPYDLCIEMRNRLYDHTVEAVRDTITLVFANVTNPHFQFVSELTKTRDRFYSFNRKIFDEDTQFRNVIDKAFNKAINEKRVCNAANKSAPNNGCKLDKDIAPDDTLNDKSDSTQSDSLSSASKFPKPAELLNRYVDHLLRKQAKSMSDLEFEKSVTQFIILFKYIDDKDAFQKHYQRSLCKRLINGGQNLMMDNEENFINQIKNVCGLEYTSPFQRMFNDIQLITQLNKTFSSYLELNPEIQVPCNSQFMVLTHCSWPINSSPLEFSLNQDLMTSFDIFHTFYVQKYQGRKLKLSHQFSTVELQLCYTHKYYFINVGSLHATILLFLDLDDSDEISLQSLKDRLNMVNDGELEKAMLSLTDNKIMNRPTDTTFILNRDFISKRTKFRLILSTKEKEINSISEHDTVDRQISDDRKFFIQAAIVRIMKSRKQLNHRMLMKEVLDQAKGRFLPAIPLIKKCIEILIDKGYMERTPDNTDVYSYLA